VLDDEIALSVSLKCELSCNEQLFFDLGIVNIIRKQQNPPPEIQTIITLSLFQTTLNHPHELQPLPSADLVWSAQQKLITLTESPPLACYVIV